MTGGTLRLGKPEKPANIVLRSGHLRLAAALDSTHLARVLVPDSTVASSGILTLDGSGVFSANRLHLASESAANNANANATLHIPADSGIESIIVHESLRMAASDIGNWQTAVRIGFDPGDGNWVMPSGIDFRIGAPDRPASILAVGHGGGWSKRGRLVAGEGGVFRAYVRDLLVGTMDRGGTGWWGSMQPEVAWTAPYNVGNDFLGTLDLSDMERCEITADTIRIGHPAVASWGTLLVGRLRLPAGTVNADAVAVGHSYPVSPEQNSDAFRPGCEAVLDLCGTRLHIARRLSIYETGRLTLRGAGPAGGIHIAADAEVVLEGVLRIVFDGYPDGRKPYYGLRWEGDRRDAIDAWIRDGRIEIVTEAPGTPADHVKVFVRDQRAEGGAKPVTYLGVEN